MLLITYNPKNRTKTGKTMVSQTPERNPGVVERCVAGQLLGVAEVRDPTPTETSSTAKVVGAEEVCDIQMIIIIYYIKSYLKCNKYY